MIDTRDSNTNLNRDILTMTGMTIDGPPAFDGSSYASLQAQLLQSGDTSHEYVGEQAIDLIRANDADNGTISNNTLQGGAIEVFGGPWTITGNTVLGSTAGTYSPGAFGLHSAYDAIVENNHVSQSDPSGREFRLVVLASGGTGDTIQGNTLGGGAGQVGDETHVQFVREPVRGDQRSRGHPGGKRLWRPVRRPAGRDLARRTPARALEPPGPRLPRRDRSRDGGLDPYRGQRQMARRT